MANKPTIKFAESAIADMEDILVWYADQRVPEVGKRLVGEVVVQVERLVDFPESGRIVPEFELSNLREIIYPPFRIVYRVDAARIWIVRVWRGERLLKLPGGVE